MLTAMLAAGGSSGYGLWVFLAGVLVGVAALAVWAVMRFRASYVQPPADVSELFTVAPEQDRERWVA